MVRKITALVLSLMMVLSFTAFAEENDKMKEVLVSVKERIPETDSFENFLYSEGEQLFCALKTLLK